MRRGGEGLRTATYTLQLLKTEGTNVINRLGKISKKTLDGGCPPSPPHPLYVQGLIVVEQCKSLT